MSVVYKTSRLFFWHERVLGRDIACGAHDCRLIDDALQTGRLKGSHFDCYT